MTAKAAIQWDRKEDERWAAAFRIHLVTTSHPPEGLAEQALSEVHETVTETGRPAESLFGAPRRYAASVAADRIDEAHTGAVALEGTARLAGGPHRARRAQRRKAHAAVAFALALAVASSDALRSLDVTSFWFWSGLLAVAFTVAQAASLYRDSRRGTR
ncbi:hypothetical protein ACFY1P_05095 [Streptomyces sp. NPDC001407]|uniref:hypothetical protein n=1 Tax=unclassified Streptomyces TaxID=2593676 RepID=UPI0033FA4E4C